MMEAEDPRPYWPVIDNAIKVLNEALAADPDAINTLFAFAVPVNQQLAEHPTIQVWNPPEQDGPTLRAIGIINGIFGVDAYDCGYICAHVESDGTIIKFDRFQQTKDQE